MLRKDSILASISQPNLFPTDSRSTGAHELVATCCGWLRAMAGATIRTECSPWQGRLHRRSPAVMGRAQQNGGVICLSVSFWGLFSLLPRTNKRRNKNKIKCWSTAVHSPFCTNSPHIPGLSRPHVSAIDIYQYSYSNTILSVSKLRIRNSTAFTLGSSMTIHLAHTTTT